MLSEARKNGILKNAKTEGTFLNNLYTVLKALKEIFCQKVHLSAFPICIKEFIISKE